MFMTVASTGAALAQSAGSDRVPEQGEAQLIEMHKRPEGATIQEIVAKLKWQAHTVRGAFGGALKKRLGLKVESEKVEGRGRVYRLRYASKLSDSSDRRLRICPISRRDQ